MNKPDDIPQDIWNASYGVAELIPVGEGDTVTVCIDDIAKAILAERERCANILLARSDPYGVLSGLVRAIRKGAE